MASAGYRFVAMPGSLRQASFTRAIAVTLDELAPDDIAVEVLTSLGNLPLYDQDLQERSTPAAVEQAAAIVGNADAVIFVTPEYNHSIPGALKNALDWFSRLSTRPLERKPVAIQSASPGPLGGARAQEHLRQVLIAIDATVLNKPEVIVTQVASKVDAGTGIIRDHDTRQQIGRQLRALADLANCA